MYIGLFSSVLIQYVVSAILLCLGILVLVIAIQFINTAQSGKPSYWLSTFCP